MSVVEETFESWYQLMPHNWAQKQFALKKKTKGHKVIYVFGCGETHCTTNIVLQRHLAVGGIQCRDVNQTAIV